MNVKLETQGSKFAITLDGKRVGQVSKTLEGRTLVRYNASLDSAYSDPKGRMCVKQVRLRTATGPGGNAGAWDVLRSAPEAKREIRAWVGEQEAIRLEAYRCRFPAALVQVAARNLLSGHGA